MDLNSSPQGNSASNVNVEGSAPSLECNSNPNGHATAVSDGPNGLVDGVIGNENGGAVNGRALPSTFIKPARMPYVNLFKNNRMANEQHKLGHFKKGTDRLKFTFDDIDPIEKTYGICLLGLVISGKPPTNALLELVRRWGKDVKFQTHDSGWIVFTFPSLDVRDRVLSAGPYLVYGYHLFLKEMPRCFRFREEDMNTLPSWVQIHGLPPYCWNYLILSNIVSELGIPIHIDMLTYGRKRVKYARVLVEMDAAIPTIYDLEINLPTGDATIKFVYEHEVKFCHECNKVGHESSNCPNLEGNELVQNTNCDHSHVKRSRSKIVMWKRDLSRGISRIATNRRRAPSRNVNRAPAANEMAAGTSVVQANGTSAVHADGMSANVSIQQAVASHSAVDKNAKICSKHKQQLSIEEQKRLAKGKQTVDSGVPEMGTPVITVDCVVDEFTVVSNKNNKKI